MHSFTQNTLKNYLGMGHSFCQTPLPLGRGHPSPDPTTLSAYGASIPSLRRFGFGAFGASMSSLPPLR